MFRFHKNHLVLYFTNHPGFFWSTAFGKCFKHMQITYGSQDQSLSTTDQNEELRLRTGVKTRNNSEKEENKGISSLEFPTSNMMPVWKNCITLHYIA